MNANASEIAKLLRENVAVIEYTHYRTGEDLTTRCTLKPDLARLDIANHSSWSDVVAFWDLDREAWGSVYVNTITKITLL